MKDRTLAELTRIVKEFRDARDWKQFHTPKELAIQLTIESAELLELMQWLNGKELDEQLARRRQHIADELSDILHGVLLMADELGIDLGKAFLEKMEKNAKKYPVEKSKGSAKKYHEL
jgi:NTP pyrophosphatase (non-canonical NTP hydrolase)